MTDLSLKKKAAKGIVWSFVDKIFNQGLQFVIAIALARLLTPADYGIIGMLSIFILVANACVDAGFSQAIIQKKDRTEEDYSTVFYINILVALVLYGALYMAAPYIADFYNAPELVNSSRVLFTVIIFDSLYIVQNAKLTIQLDFKRKAKFNVFALAGSGVVGLLLAFGGAGVWSLVFQSLSRSVIYLIIITLSYRWKPQFGFSFSSTVKLFSFGSKLMLTSILSTITQNLYQIMIGRYFNTETVGYYTQGKKFAVILSHTVSGILQTVTFPIMASIQDDKERLVSVFKRIMRMTVFITIPSMAGLAIIAKPFVLLFLSEKWLPSVIVLQGFCVARAFVPIIGINISIINAIGRSDVVLKLLLSQTPIMLTLLYLSVPYGLEAVVFVQVITSAINFFAFSYYSGKLFGYGVWEQIKDLAPTLLSSLLMLSVLQLLQFDNYLLQISSVVGIGVIIYIIFSYIFKVESLFEFTAMLKSFAKS